MIKENPNSNRNEVKLLLLLSKLRHLNRCNWTHRVLVTSLDYRKYSIFSIFLSRNVVEFNVQPIL